MNNYIISSLATSFTTLALALFVFLKNKKRPLNRTFALYTVSIGVWSYGFYRMITASNIEQGLFWSRALHIGALFIPTLFLHFVLIMIERAKKQKKIIIATYIISFIFLLLCPTKFFVSTPVPKDVFRYFVNPGPLYWAYPAFFFSCIVYTHYELFRAYRKSRGLKKNQIKYLLLAYWLGYTGGATAFFPLFNIHMPSFGLYTIPACMIMIAWIIIRYQLLDITFVFRQMMVSAAYALILAIVFLPVIFLVRNSFFYLGITVTILILTAPYIYTLLAKHFFSIVDILVFKKKYSYTDKLDKFIEDMILIHEQKDLFKNTINNLAAILGTNKVAILTLDHIHNDYIIRAKTEMEDVENFTIAADNALIQWLKKHKDVFIREEADKLLSREDTAVINNILNSLEATMCIPTMLKEDLVGIITLGEKSSGQMYSHIDTSILHRLGTQFAIVLDYKRVEAELRKKSEYEAVGKMAMEISHETRNLLVPVKTFMQMLPEKLNDPEFMGSFRQIADTNIDAMARKTEDILFFTERKLPAFIKDADVNKVLNNVVYGLQEKIKKENITVVKELNSLPPVMADRNLLLHIFTNLIVNALDAMKGREGKIRIRSQIHSAPTGQMQEISSRWIRVEVKDDGPGIPPEIKEKVFDAFVTTKSGGGSLQKHGAGLGLAVVKRAVDDHHGIISVDSKINKGTTFVIDLPVDQKI